MSSSGRYKFVENLNGDLPATINSFYNNGDGDDKQIKTINRVLSAGDIGDDLGQIGHLYGCIIDTLPMSTNVLLIEGSTYRPATDKVNGMTFYNLLDNQVDTAPNPQTIVEIYYGIGLDNTIRATNKTHSAFPSKVGDLIIIRIHTGTNENPRNILNPP